MANTSRTSGPVRTILLTLVAAGALSAPALAAGASDGARRQDVAASKAGVIPGLGAVSATVRWDGRQELVLHGADFEVARSHDPATREATIHLRGQGEAAVTIRLGGPGGLSISRGGKTVRGTSDLRAIQRLLDGRSVAAARARLGAFDRRMAADPVTRMDDPHSYGFLLVGALISSLHGDPAALGRARDLMVRRARGRTRAIRFEFKQCVQDYERYLLELDTDRTNCLEAANGRSSWYARAADRLACEVEFMAGALAGEGQFVSCTALGSLL